MFERFTTEARDVVVLAQREARELRHGHIDTEHLLLGLLDQPWTPTGQVLDRHGLTRAAVVEAVTALGNGADFDAEALRAVGIDLDAVRDRVEATFGPGALDAGGPARRNAPAHIPFTPRAKKVMELSLREAIALRSRSIREGHIALALLREGGGVAMEVLTGRGADPQTLRADITQALAS